MTRAVRAYGPALISRWCTPSSRFVILTSGRTGSELLVSLLDSHPRIRCAGELLKEERAFPHRYLSARAAMARLRGFETFGWKVALNQIRSLGNPGAGLRGMGDPRQYPARLHAMGFRLILSTRRNPVDQALSGLRAMRDGFHHRAGAHPTFAPFAVDPVDLMTLTNILEGDASRLGTMVASVPHLRLTYEDDLLDSACHQATVDRVCDYLGIASAPVASNLVKVAPRTLRASVTNYDEIMDLFQNTRYATYLDDDERAVPAS
jgi:LPS sulfotransferase NodH